MRGKVNLRHGRTVCAAAFAAAMMIGGFGVARGAALFSDGFETYTGGGNPLDKNTAGPNSAPNGSGNPWFGPVPPNLRVVASGDTVATGSPVAAHSGTQMTRGSAPGDFDENWVNIAYR